MTLGKAQGRRACAGPLLLILTVAPCEGQAIGISLSSVPAHGQAQPDPRIGIYRLDRSEEDWRFLSDDSRREDVWDPLKYVRLSRPEDWFASFGGELRFLYENYRNYNWGAGSQDADGYLLSRFIGHGDLHLGRRARVFVEFKSGLVAGRNGGPRPPDEDQLDIGQAWVDFSLEPRESTSAVSVRIGRQELAYDAGALVAIRELNVRRAFDGVRARLRSERWTTDGFWVRPATTRTGVFDDSSDSSQMFWGLHASQQRRQLSRIGGWSVYYLGLRRETARFDQGLAREVRHSLVSGGIASVGRDARRRPS